MPSLWTSKWQKEIETMKFNKIADDYLQELYNSVGAVTIQNKIKLLSLILDGEGNISSRGRVTEAMRLGVLEYEMLESAGLIQLSLV
jgi:hypothetical protein